MLSFIAGNFLGPFSNDLYRLGKGWLFPRTAPLSTQINNVISRAAKDGFRLVGPPRLSRFRAAGAPSWMLLFRPIDGSSGISDELRIYDVVKGRLKLRLQFRPQAAVRKDPVLPPVSSARGLRLPRSFSIRLRLVHDLDGVPGNEVVADLSEFGVTPVWPRPVYIYWDAATQTFRIGALLSPATTHRSSMRGTITRKYLRVSDAYARALIDDVYMWPTTIADAMKSTPAISSYAVEAYAVKEERLEDPRGATAGGLALTAGYVVKASGYGTPDLLQAVTWHIDLRRDPITAKASSSPPLIIRVGAKVSRLTALLARASR